MKAVDQDIFVNDPDGRTGNCLQAAIASILHLNLNNVPHFADEAGDGWYKSMIMWLWDKGYSFVDVEKPFYYTGYVIACIVSERGSQHAVIYCNGELVHDPHPSRAGIDKPNHYYIIGKQP